MISYPQTVPNRTQVISAASAVPITIEIHLNENLFAYAVNSMENAFPPPHTPLSSLPALLPKYYWSCAWPHLKCKVKKSSRPWVCFICCEAIRVIRNISYYFDFFFFSSYMLPSITPAASVLPPSLSLCQSRVSLRVRFQLNYSQTPAEWGKGNCRIRNA